MDEATSARARSRKVMIASPIYSHPTFQFMDSLINSVLELERAGIAHECAFVRGVSNIPQARNYLTARFLASDCTDLLFIDADIGWPHGVIVRLLGSDKLVRGAIYRKKIDLPACLDPRWGWVADSEGEIGGSIPADDTGFLKFKRIGTGFMMISREVFERLIEAHPEWKCSDPQNTLAYMLPGVRERYCRFFRFLDDEAETGEDYSFCNAWTALGGEIWVDPTTQLAHVGEREFRGVITPVAA